jgi:hypothetical protein
MTKTAPFTPEEIERIERAKPESMSDRLERLGIELEAKRAAALQQEAENAAYFAENGERLLQDAQRRLQDTDDRYQNVLMFILFGGIALTLAGLLGFLPGLPFGIAMCWFCWRRIR